MDLHSARPRASASASPALSRSDGTRCASWSSTTSPTWPETVAGALRYEQWDVRTAGDGASAIRTAHSFRPDAVVLDWMLPALRRVRATARSALPGERLR